MKFFKSIFVFFIGFTISLLIFSYYTEGDQIAYNNFYNEIEGKSLLESYLLQGVFVSATEPVFTLIYWLGSHLNFEKEIYISIFNGLLILLTFRLFVSFNQSYLTIILFELGYYNLVLMFAAERLKFAILFLVLALLNRKSNYKYFYSVLAFLSHLSTILYFHLGFLKHLKLSYKLRIKKSTFAIMILASIFLSIFFLNLPVIAKLSASEEKFRFINFIPSLIILFDLYRLTRNQKEIRNSILLKFLPIVLPITILGPTRINMLIYLLYTYEIISLKKDKTIIFQLTLFYNVLKSIIFISNIFRYGEGFNVN